MLTTPGGVDLFHQIFLSILRKNFLTIKKEVTKIRFILAPFMHFLTSGSTILPRCSCTLCSRRGASEDHSAGLQQWPLSLSTKDHCIFSAQFEKRGQYAPVCFFSPGQALQINILMSVASVDRLRTAEPALAQWSLASSFRWWCKKRIGLFALMEARHNCCG